jgi:hypothetical protein
MTFINSLAKGRQREAAFASMPMSVLMREGFGADALLPTHAARSALLFIVDTHRSMAIVNRIRLSRHDGLLYTAIDTLHSN